MGATLSGGVGGGTPEFQVKSTFSWLARIHKEEGTEKTVVAVKRLLNGGNCRNGQLVPC
jgi:hypothetical protein